MTDERSEWPECEEFYNLMQAYRWSRAPLDVAAAYNAVQDWLRETGMPRDEGKAHG